ncbi:Atg16p [Ascoidea rubescens DSM 1968]|uniref:Autophagy protein 16 n=1 Tax=Ascoidea rubescens DSM 1968 TaxID=1344418 RepID=A0A1D2VDQ4_9ASCO|nr:autophagy protein 16 [Ascoidea rubescens DSM 1968]ODV59597.1 autophagy protein 16 [Ascoidea rubescens DSM 1968]
MDSRADELWKEKVVRLLDQRDAYEDLSTEYFHSFHVLLERAFLVEPLLAANSQLLSSPNSPDHKSAAQLLAQLSVLKKQNETLSLNCSRLSSSNKDLVSDVNNLKKHLNFKVEENLMKNNALNLINDELLSLQIQNNLLQDKISNLESENQTLVNRWIDKVKSDADKINDANDFLQNYKNFTKKK